MKKTLFLLGSIALSWCTMAQVNTPALSPKAEIEQTVGLTEFELTYSRPSLRGRDMYKEIIPVDKMWRFGANKNSTLSFDTDVVFGGVDVKAGEYAIFAIPGEKEWTIFLYDDTNNWGVPKEWNDKKVVAKIGVESKKTPHTVETFTVAFENLNIDKFDMTIAWGKTYLPIHIKLPTDKLTRESIKETMSSEEPTERDYYNAASYLLNVNADLENALTYMNKAIEMNDNAPFYYIRKKALILHANGENEKAISTAKKSLEMAKAAGSEEYVRKNEKSIKEWSK
ncbi:dihydrolipoamide dehydrogenase [Brumimicrobium salinarum]|uniref:Dihydrolipoamide dehydrogenase n=1 Tax=Brumimicrobium salinarum TaxID=2058658 RepID=A0A2I0R4U1_9FLAO|nr:DUF2911 domain-containing protein [Brumimicrobium salinarum]PKR81578.1 dihydrolipoamide dehydrogenase [Brumimicrobium salinarum]